MPLALDATAASVVDSTAAFPRQKKKSHSQATKKPATRPQQKFIMSFSFESLDYRQLGKLKQMTQLFSEGLAFLALCLLTLHGLA
jgi:hypothetical protein